MFQRADFVLRKGGSFTSEVANNGWCSEGRDFSVPYEMAVVRPLRQTTEPERASRTGQSAYYNTELIPQDLIYIDLADR